MSMNKWVTFTDAETEIQRDQNHAQGKLLINYWNEFLILVAFLRRHIARDREGTIEAGNNPSDFNTDALSHLLPQSFMTHCVHLRLELLKFIFF